MQLGSYVKEWKITIHRIKPLKLNLRADDTSEKTMTDPMDETTPKPTINGSCKYGATVSGSYKFKITGSPEFDVYCDMDTDGGEWLVIQRRKDGSVDFYRDWQQYKVGFGDATGEFWLGNDVIHTLTSTSSHELRIDLWDWDSTKAYAKYETFRIGPESEKYQLHVGGYSGTAGESMNYNNKQAFSTKDRDNDLVTDHSVAVMVRGAWWYEHGTQSNLNGYYYPQATFSGDIRAGICWYRWRDRWSYSLKGSEMKIRPK